MLSAFLPLTSIPEVVLSLTVLTYFIKNLKQNEAQSVRAESTHKELISG